MCPQGFDLITRTTRRMNNMKKRVEEEIGNINSTWNLASMLGMLGLEESVAN